MRYALALLVVLTACESPTGSTPPDPSREARALWVSRFEYASAAEIETIMARADAGGFNVVFFQVRGAADAFYDSDLEPCAASLCGRLGGSNRPYDPLAVAVQSAHSRGLELHAWINALTARPAGSAAACATLAESEPGEPRHVALQHPEWVMVDSLGATQACPNAIEYVWLSPGVAGVRTHIARVAADIARRYAVDGIHLDRIRYPGRAWSYDTASTRAFGQDPFAARAAWDDFRRQLIGLVVRETRDSVVAARPSAILSAAVWGINENVWGWSAVSRGRHDYLQDPRAWALAGALDVAVPMTYWAASATRCARLDWVCLLDDHLAGYPARPVWIGINASLGNEEVLRQIAAGRERRVPGFAIYSYSAAHANNLFDALARGPFSSEAVVP